MKRPCFWYIALGENTQEGTDRREYLANGYSLIMIDYSLKKDTSKMTDLQINQHVEDCNQPDDQGNLSHQDYQRKLERHKNVIRVYKQQVRCFKNQVEIGDSVICPFIRYGRQVRIGVIAGDFKPLKSYLGRKFNNFAKNHNAQNNAFSPTRLVQWQTILIDEIIMDEKIKERTKVGRLKTVNPIYLDKL